MAILTNYRWNNLIDTVNNNLPEDTPVSNVGSNHLLSVADWDAIRNQLLIHQAGNYFRYGTPDIWDAKSTFDLLDVAISTFYNTTFGSTEAYVIHSQEWANGTGFDTWDYFAAGQALPDGASTPWQSRVARLDIYTKITEFDDTSTPSILTVEFAWTAPSATPGVIYDRVDTGSGVTETPLDVRWRRIPRIDDNSPITRTAEMPDGTIIRNVPSMLTS